MRTPDWITACGDSIPLSAMSTTHILNAARYIVAGDGDCGPMSRDGCGGFCNAEWLVLFNAELLRRSRSGQL